MGKNKSQKEKQRRRRERARKQLQETQSTTPSIRETAVGILKKSWWLASAVALIWTTWIVIRPSVTAEPLNALKPEEPFSTQFALRNTGATRIHDGIFSCEAPHVSGNGITIENFVGTITDKQNNNFGDIEPGEPVTVSCGSHIKGLTDVTAVIILVLRFRSGWIPIRFEKRFRFETRKSDSGKTFWIPMPLSTRS